MPRGHAGAALTVAKFKTVGWGDRVTRPASGRLPAHAHVLENTLLQLLLIVAWEPNWKAGVRTHELTKLYKFDQLSATEQLQSDVV